MKEVSIQRCLALSIALALLTAITSGLAWAGDGEALYGEHCATCHGADGRADTPLGKALKVPSLVDPKWTSADTAEALVTAFHANPKHKTVESKVTDDELRAIATHVAKLAGAAQ